MGMTCRSGLRSRCVFVPLVTNLSFLFKTPRIYLTFLSQHNDFNIKEYHETSSFRQIWLDTPGDQLKDICACWFAGEIHPLYDSQIRCHLSSFCIAKTNNGVFMLFIRQSIGYLPAWSCSLTIYSNSLLFSGTTDIIKSWFPPVN